MHIKWYSALYSCIFIEEKFKKYFNIPRSWNSLIISLLLYDKGIIKIVSLISSFYILIKISHIMVEIIEMRNSWKIKVIKELVSWKF